MQIKIWGVRGSLPAPLAPSEIQSRVAEVMREFLSQGRKDVSEIESFLKTVPPEKLGGYGGNTPSIEVSSGEAHLIIDGGSGIRALGEKLMEGPCGQGKGRVDILMTHFHWDHLIGLPFFRPLYVPGNEVHFHAVQPELPAVISTLFKRPFFPVEIAKLESKIFFNQLKPREPIHFGDIKVTPYQLDHPDPCWGYKIEQGGKVFSHCVDSETSRFSREELGPDLPLYQNVDLLLFDAQYDLLESIRKENWGHGSAMLGIDLAKREGIKKILFMHHDPYSADERVHGIESDVKKYDDRQKKRDRKI